MNFFRLPIALVHVFEWAKMEKPAELSAYTSKRIFHHLSIESTEYSAAARMRTPSKLDAKHLLWRFIFRPNMHIIW